MNRRTGPVATLLLLGACGGGVPAGPVIPPGDAEREIQAVTETNRLEQPTQLFFEWSAQEPEFRGSGSGVARLEPPDRARLDLFLDNGEQVAEAVLVGDELRIPPWVEVGMIPPPPLLWASLGIFSPGANATFFELRGGGSQQEASYDLDGGDRIRYSIEGRRIVRVSVVRDSDVIRTMTVDEPGPASRHPDAATYRDIPDFRELKVRLESVEYVEGFPSDIWGVANP